MRVDPGDSGRALDLAHREAVPARSHEVSHDGEARLVAELGENRGGGGEFDGHGRNVGPRIGLVNGISRNIEIALH